MKRLLYCLMLIALLGAQVPGLSAQPGGWLPAGCYRCVDDGGVGITGASQWSCAHVGDARNGEGIYCREINFGGAGRECITSGGFCFYIIIVA